MANEHQAGVLVRGPGTSTSDSIPAALSDGELVIPADDVRRFGAAHLMRMVKEMGSQLPAPSMKEGVQHAATGGLMTDPNAPQTNAVTRVGNSYTGGSVGGSVTINGAAPGGTVSTIESYKVPAPPPPQPPLGQPASMVPIVPKPAVPGTTAAAAPIATPTPAPAPASAPVPGAGIINAQPTQQVRSILVPPAASPAPVARPQPVPAYANGGLVDQALLDAAKRAGNIALNPVGRAYEAVKDAGSELTSGLTGGAATGVFPQMPSGGTPAPRALATQAQVRAVDAKPAAAAAIAAAPTAPTAAPAPTPSASADTPAANDPLPLSSRGNVTALGGASSADRTAQMNRDAEATRSLSARAIELAQQGVGGPTPGMGVIGPVDYANRNADFNDSAQLRTVLARGAPPGRNGAQVFQQQVQGAAMPLIQRAQQRETETQQAAATGRAQIAEQGLAARAKIADARQAEANAIDRAKLGIEAVRASHAGLPAGYRMKADGTGLEFIPGGPADPDTAKGKNALTDSQSKALLFGSRMQASNKILNDLQAGGKMFSTPGANAPYVGGLVNLVNSEQGQQLDQAKRDFLNATLRRESGAVISPAEFDNGDKQYFPQPGDSPKVIEQKRQNREVAIRGILAEVPNSDQRAASVVGSAGNAAAPTALPTGMTRQVGTSGGKPVYENAQGQRFIGG